MLMKKVVIGTYLVLSIFLLSCQRTPDFKTYDFFAMDTYVSISADNSDAFESVAQYTKSLEDKLSKTKEQSEIYELSKESRTVLSEDTAYILQKSLEISENTDGAFDVCLGQIVDLWDITSGKNIVPDTESIEIAKSKSGYEKLVLDGLLAKLSDGAKVDLGGVAKGYCAEQCVEVLKENGAQNVCISFGGNVAVCGSSQNNLAKNKEGWNVGIKNPDFSDDIVGYVNVCDKVVAVSGDYERFFEKDGQKYHHIFDVRTGYPAKTNVRSVAVISKDGLVADALSTALFVMGTQNASEFYNEKIYDFEAVFICNDASIYITKGIKDKFIPNKDALNSDGEKYTVKVLDL